MKAKLLFWIPRALAIAAILFMMLFSLDCFVEEYSFGEKLSCFFMHNIPAYICILAVVVAWKKELIGGILFLLIFVGAGLFFHSFEGNYGSLIVISPFLLIGILFIVYHKLIIKSD